MRLAGTYQSAMNRTVVLEGYREDLIRSRDRRLSRESTAVQRQLQRMQAPCGGIGTSCAVRPLDRRCCYMHTVVSAAHRLRAQKHPCDDVSVPGCRQASTSLTELHRCAYVDPSRHSPHTSAVGWSRPTNAYLDRTRLPQMNSNLK